MSDSRPPLSVEIDDIVKTDRARNYWYSAQGAQFAPSLQDMREVEAVEKYITAGWSPAAPFIDRSTKVTVFGSCFSTMLAEHLKTLAYPSAPGETDAENIVVNETLMTTRAMRQLFEWEFENIKPSPEDLTANRVLNINFADELWKTTIARLSSTDVFVLLLAQAEVWCDEPTGAVLWREVPGASSARQIFRTTSVEENRADLRVIYDLMRKHRPHARLICAVSPITMIATYRQTSCITANVISKSVLRVAMDELHREIGEEGHFFYWPLYDVITEGFGATPYGGQLNGDRRHINDAALDYMLAQFTRDYCIEPAPARPLLDLYVAARIDTQDLPRVVQDAVQSANRRAVRHLIDRYRREDDAQTADLVERYATQTLSLRIDPGDNVPWVESDLPWRQLPGLQAAEPGARVFTTPPVAWDYGAVSDPVRASGPGDLLLRLEVEALAGTIGVLLIRPDGSALDDVDQPVRPEDGVATVELRVYPQDGPAHILLRNYDDDGVAGRVKVRRLFLRG